MGSLQQNPIKGGAVVYSMAWIVIYLGLHCSPFVVKISPLTLHGSGAHQGSGQDSCKTISGVVVTL